MKTSTELIISSIWLMSCSMGRCRSGEARSMRKRTRAKGVRRWWLMAPTMAVLSSTKRFSRACMVENARAARPISAGPERAIASPEGSRPSRSAARAKASSGRARRRANSQARGPTMRSATANHRATRRCQLLGKGSGRGCTTAQRPPDRRAATKSPCTNGRGPDRRGRGAQAPAHARCSRRFRRCGRRPGTRVRSRPGQRRRRDRRPSFPRPAWAPRRTSCPRRAGRRGR